MIEALIFDLDDTLYFESDFVSSGYCAVARHVSECYGRPYKDVYYTMMNVLATAGRREVLPMVLSRFEISGVPISELVDVYRQHLPKIRLIPGYRKILNGLKKRYRLGILTDGLPEVQARKIKALRLEKSVDWITYSWELGPENGKPNPGGFMQILKELNTDCSRSICIGDNPEKDGKGAHAAGMKFVLVRVPGKNSIGMSQESCREEEFAIDTLFELPPLLECIAGHE